MQIVHTFFYSAFYEEVHRINENLLCEERAKETFFLNKVFYWHVSWVSMRRCFDLSVSVWPWDIVLVRLSLWRKTDGLLSRATRGCDILVYYCRFETWSLTLHLDYSWTNLEKTSLSWFWRSNHTWNRSFFAYLKESEGHIFLNILIYKKCCFRPTRGNTATWGLN